MQVVQQTPQDRHEVLQEKITALCSNLYAADYELLGLIREFDECGGWADTGVYHCAHWLNFSCGISMTTAHEKVRIAHALPALPLISDAFRRGEISYSKVRAMTRVATPENEEFLLMIARHGTASHIERLVRQYRLVKDSEDRSLAQRAFAGRELRAFFDDDGLAGLIVKLPADCTAKTLEVINQIMVAGWKANRRAGEDSEKGKDEEDKTESKASAENGTAGDVISDVINNDDAVQGAKLLRDPIGAQRADAFMTMIDSVLAGNLTLDPTPDRAQIIVHVDIDALSGDDPESDCHLEHGDRICTDAARRLSCDANIIRIHERDGEPLNIGRKTRSIPSGMRRALESRDRGCRFPGCNRYYHTDGHHIEHWAHGGETSLDNLVLLCRFHHRLVHEDGFGCERRTDGQLVFSDPNGRLLPTHYPLGATAALDYNLPANACVPNWHGDTMDYSRALETLEDIS